MKGLREEGRGGGESLVRGIRNRSTVRVSVIVCWRREGKQGEREEVVKKGGVEFEERRNIDRRIKKRIWRSLPPPSVKKYDTSEWQPRSCRRKEKQQQQYEQMGIRTLNFEETRSIER